MSNRWLRSVGFVLVLALGSLSHAQRGGRPQEPPARCTCSAEGADCLFGSAGGCQVTCPGSGCECLGAWCALGFPRPAICRCNGLST